MRLVAEIQYLKQKGRRAKSGDQSYGVADSVKAPAPPDGKKKSDVLNVGAKPPVSGSKKPKADSKTDKNLNFSTRKSASGGVRANPAVGNPGVAPAAAQGGAK